MENYTWKTDFLTLELLPCGTIHMESTGIDGDTDEEFTTFDKINTICIDKENDSLVLESDSMSYEYPQLANQFLTETNGRFPISEPTKLPQFLFSTGQWDENGKPIDIIMATEEKIERIQAIPGGDYLNTTLLQLQ